MFSSRGVEHRSSASTADCSHGVFHRRCLCKRWSPKLQSLLSVRRWEMRCPPHPFPVPWGAYVAIGKAAIKRPKCAHVCEWVHMCVCVAGDPTRHCVFLLNETLRLKTIQNTPYSPKNETKTPSQPFWSNFLGCTLYWNSNYWHFHFNTGTNPDWRPLTG